MAIRNGSYQESDRAKALLRLARLKGRPTPVCAGGNRGLEGCYNLGEFTFLPVTVKKFSASLMIPTSMATPSSGPIERSQLIED